MANLMKSIKELNEKSKRKCIYVLIAGDQMIASTAKHEIDDYLKSDESIITPYVDIDEVSMLYGFQLDTEILPYEISGEAKKDRYLWLLINDDGDVYCERLDTLREVTEYIASYMYKNPEMDITDFTVLLGAELDLVMSVGSSGPYI